MGGRRLGSPARIDHFDLGRDSAKGGKMVTAATMALRADMQRDSKIQDDTHTRREGSRDWGAPS